MPSSPTDDQRTLRVLSFNVWGLALISKDRQVRIKAIAEALGSASYDIVCLQELWIYKDFETVRDEVLQVLPFSRFFHSGALGSGLAIFTRFPIISAQALPYSLSGTPQHAIEGDFFVKKSAGNIVILHPLLGEVEIWNTHMHAAGEHPPDTRQAHRIAESWQLANAIRSGAAKGRYILCMGDFNSQPYSIPIQILRAHGDLNDAFLDTHPHANDPSSPLSPSMALRASGMTCDSPLNTYSAGKPIPENIRAAGGKRLDYIFYRQPEVARRRPLIWGYRDRDTSGGGQANGGEGLEEGKPIESSTDKAPILCCTSSDVIMTERVPGQAFSYSDHFALFSTFTVEYPSDRAQRKGISQSGQNGGSGLGLRDSSTASTFTPLVPLISDEPSPLNPTTTTFAPPSPPPTHSPRASSSSSKSSKKSGHIRAALHTLREYSLISKRTARIHLRIFVAAVVGLVALTIGSAWQPKSWIQPVFTLLGGALGAAGATFLYTGFVWGRWEQGLLEEVREEMELELRVVEMEERA